MANTERKEQIQPKYSIEELREKFRSLDLRYTMKAFRYCAENKVTLDELRIFTPKNHLDLVMLGTPDIKPEQAEGVITKWIDWGYTMPLLHALCLEAAKESGFFTTEDDLVVMGEMAKQDKSFLNLILPLVLNTSEGQMAMYASMLEQVQQKENQEENQNQGKTL